MTQPVRLLWVDSDDQFVAPAILALKGRGWIADHARTQFEALDRATRHSYDVVIIDLQLADALGTDAWFHIKRLQPDIIGIMTTHSASLHMLVRVDAPDIVAYLGKTAAISEIAEIVTGALAKRKSGGATAESWPAR